MYGDPSRSRILSDLSGATPAAVLSRRHTPGHWQVVDYQIEGLAGRLVGPLHTRVDSSYPAMPTMYGGSRRRPTT